MHYIGYEEIRLKFKSLALHIFDQEMPEPAGTTLKDSLLAVQMMYYDAVIAEYPDHILIRIIKDTALEFGIQPELLSSTSKELFEAFTRNNLAFPPLENINTTIYGTLNNLRGAMEHSILENHVTKTLVLNKIRENDTKMDAMMMKQDLIVQLLQQIVANSSPALAQPAQQPVHYENNEIQPVAAVEQLAAPSRLSAHLLRLADMTQTLDFSITLLMTWQHARVPPQKKRSVWPHSGTIISFAALLIQIFLQFLLLRHFLGQIYMAANSSSNNCNSIQLAA